MKYRKRPVVIDAWLIKDLIEKSDFSFVGKSPLPEPVYDAVMQGTIRVSPEALYIQTLEGLHTGQPTDMLIMGVKGEFYPCKPDIFEATYENAEDAPRD